MLQFWISILPVAALLILGYTVGSVRERRHLAQLDRREGEFADLRVNNLKRISAPECVRGATLVMGQAVIGTDYFKSFAARLRNIIGGEIHAFETLLLRARREAMLRMLEEAQAFGATEVWNVRYETSNIMSAAKNNPAVSVEIFAYGTAVRRA